MKKENSRNDPDLDADGLPNKEGVYLVDVPHEEGEREIDVYYYEPKGLCCFADDFGSSGTGVDDEHDCHVSVQFSGLKFIRRIRDF